MQENNSGQRYKMNQYSSSNLQKAQLGELLEIDLENLDFRIEDQLQEARLNYKNKNTSLNSTQKNINNREKKKHISQTHQIQFNQFFYSDTTAKQNTQQIQKKKREKVAEGKKRKNFLTIIKRCIIRLFERELSQIQDPQILQFLQNKGKSNRFQFENLFRTKEVISYLSQLFESKRLQRQIQLTRTVGFNRKVFLNQINRLRKFFILFCRKQELRTKDEQREETNQQQYMDNN